MGAILLHPLLVDCRRLFLRNYTVNMRIGAHEFEKKIEQRVVFNIDLFVPLTLSTPVSDELNEVLDYGLMRQTILHHAKRGHIHLQETLCDAIAKSLLAHPVVRAVRVRTEKPDAYADSEAIGVEVFYVEE